MKKTKINNNVIRDFINDFYGIELQSKNREGHIAKARVFYYYMCFKFSNDITSAKQVAISINKKQHGTVLSHLEKMEDLKVYDKVGFKKYQVLESKFLEEFEPFKSDDEFYIDTKDALMLKTRVKRLLKKNKILQDKIIQMKIKIGEELLKRVS